MMTWLGWNGALLLLAYLLGSIPTGYVVGRLNGIDIREHGSKSTGATNVLRVIGKVAGISVLLIDILKAVTAIVFVRWLYSSAAVEVLTPAGLESSEWQAWVIMATGLMVLLGHSKSVWIGFTGGKSVASGLGVFLSMSPPVGLSALSVFGLVLAVSRIVSLSSMAAAIAAIVFMFVFQQPLPYALMAIVGGSYVILRHQQNIRRLLAGKEPKLGQKASTNVDTDAPAQPSSPAS